MEGGGGMAACFKENTALRKHGAGKHGVGAKWTREVGAEEGVEVCGGECKPWPWT